MTITTMKLTRVAGLAGVAAGLIFILIQCIHPAENATTVTTAEWALWLNHVTPRETVAAQLVFLFRLAAGSGMTISIVLGATTIRRGDIAGHRAWMIRAYALAFGAATHVFTIGIGQAVFGESELTNALTQGTGWVINVAIAERAIRRRPSRRPAPSLTGMALS